MSNIEADRSSPSADLTVRIAQALGEQPTKLLQMAGLVTPETLSELARRPTFAQFVRSDPNLTAAQKRQLVSLYALFVKGGRAS